MDHTGGDFAAGAWPVSGEAAGLFALPSFSFLKSAARLLLYADLSSALHARSASAPAVKAARRAGKDVLQLLSRRVVVVGRTGSSAEMTPDGVSGALRALYPQRKDGVGRMGLQGGEGGAVVAVVKVSAEG